MNIEALNQLKRVLQNIPDAENSFSMEEWILSPAPEAEACGTTCCAIGYAALDPWFQGEGLRLVAGDGCQIASIAEFNNAALTHHRLGTGDEFVASPYFKDAEGFKAAMTLFDIGFGTSDWLFNSQQYDGHEATPADVIARIDRLLVSGERQP